MPGLAAGHLINFVLSCIPSLLSINQILNIYWPPNITNIELLIGNFVLILHYESEYFPNLHISPMSKVQTEAKKVLIVEDDNIQQIILERLISEMGHTVIGSSSEGSQAIESALRIGAVDLIFMDINLADGVDGIEAAKEISKHREVKLVYITSSDDPDHLSRANETDYIAYLTKPLTKTMLEETFLKAFPAHS